MEWWNSGMVGRASLLSKLEVKCVILELYVDFKRILKLLEGQAPS